MNKQEAIGALQEMAQDSFEVVKINAVHIDNIVEVINQIDEPQKVVVPKFVAEWLEEARTEEFSLYGAWEMVKEGSEIFWWLFDGHESNQDTFNRAWLDGYEIEQEKLYKVEIPNPNSAGGELVLFKQQSSGRLILDMLNPNINKPKYLHITESEIKKDFEWAFQFAKPVEEK